MVPGAGDTGRTPEEPRPLEPQTRRGEGRSWSTSSKFSKCSPFSKYVRLKKSLKPDYFTSYPRNKVLPKPYNLLPFTGIHEKKRHKKWMVINIYY